MDIEDSYIVRIYRRAPSNAKAGVHDGTPRLVGVVESPGTGQRRAFHDIEELWTALAESGSAATGRKRRPARIET